MSFAVAESINPTPPDQQPVSLGQGQDVASPYRSPVPPLTQTDPNFPTVKDPAAIPTPQPNVTAPANPSENQKTLFLLPSELPLN
jgi:hypothetical protein